MGKKKVQQFSLADPDLLYVDMPEDLLFDVWRSWYPRGSGPLGAMKTICALIENVAHLRGIDVSNWQERANQFHSRMT